MFIGIKLKDGFFINNMYIEFWMWFVYYIVGVRVCNKNLFFELGFVVDYLKINIWEKLVGTKLILFNGYF